MFASVSPEEAVAGAAEVATPPRPKRLQALKASASGRSGKDRRGMVCRGEGLIG
jgi:hypothetical protein